jgi:uncharacterized membrane protein YeiH
MGGVIRDVVVNEVPALFHPGAFYATASFTGSLAFIAALENGMAYTPAAVLGVVVVAMLRLVSATLGVRVPAAQWADKEDEHRL